MKKYAWITDSASGLSKKFIQENNIFVLPLNVIIDGVSYKEDVDITKDHFYEKLKQKNIDAKTSQPVFGDFIKLFNELKEKYDGGIAVHASSALTGTYQSAKSAAAQTGFPVLAIDSKIGAYPLGQMIKNGIQLVKQGLSYEKIVDALKTYPGKSEMFILPSNLEQLKKSGRVSNAQSIFASLLNIHLLLRVDQGKVVVAEKIRTKTRAKNRLFQIIENAVNKYQLREICIMHAGVLEKALSWKAELEKMHQRTKVKIETLVPVAGVHTGFGTMAVSWLFD